MTEPDFVPIVPRRITQLADLVGASRVARVTTVAQRLLERVGPRTLWHVNSTATGGGVAEMLHALLGYVVDLGVETRWVVIDADGDFFALTKRLHNRLHGAPTGHGFDDADRSLFDAVSARNADTLVAAVRPGDMVVLHDPQTAGLAPALVKHGATVVWRCHIGIDRQTPVSLDAWDFLRADILPAQAHVFSRATYRPDFLPAATTAVIPPSIDPFAIKHQELDAPTVIAILQAAGLLVGKPDCPPVYAARDGSSAVVVRGAEVVADELPRPGVPLAAQVSRWDRLKDMAGVMKAFAEHVVPSGPGYLILAGPQINGVADDPEGAEVYNECLTAWRELPLDARRRVMLANLPMADVDENAVMVNALQRYATVVVQKSLAEGFGLTVAEAMFKRRPVVGSRVGGIADQIVDGTGFLVEPTDHAAFGAAVRWLLDDPVRAAAMGEAARQHVCHSYLADTQLLRWMDLTAALFG